MDVVFDLPDEDHSPEAAERMPQLTAADSIGLSLRLVELGQNDPTILQLKMAQPEASAWVDEIRHNIIAHDPRHKDFWVRDDPNSAYEGKKASTEPVITKDSPMLFAQRKSSSNSSPLDAAPASEAALLQQRGAPPSEDSLLQQRGPPPPSSAGAAAGSDAV